MRYNIFTEPEYKPDISLKIQSEHASIALLTHSAMFLFKWCPMNKSTGQFWNRTFTREMARSKSALNSVYKHCGFKWENVLHWLLKAPSLQTEGSMQPDWDLGWHNFDRWSSQTEPECMWILTCLVSVATYYQWRLRFGKAVNSIKSQHLFC